MTKEEKIRDEWDKLCPNSQLKICMNTGYVVTYCTNGISDIVDNSIINEEDIDWIDLSEDLTKWRPRSLQGIENNNGWIKIESENDLPKKRGKYLTIRENGITTTEWFYKNNLSWYLWKICYSITHYQPIQKPPIY